MGNERKCARCGSEDLAKRAAYCKSCKKPRKAETDKAWREAHPRVKSEKVQETTN